MDYTHVLKYTLLIIVIFAFLHIAAMQLAPDWSMGHGGIFTGVAVAALLGLAAEQTMMI